MGELDPMFWIKAAPVHMDASDEYRPRLKSALVILIVKPPKVMVKSISVVQGYS